MNWKGKHMASLYIRFTSQSYTDTRPHICTLMYAFMNTFTSKYTRKQTSRRNNTVVANSIPVIVTMQHL